MKRQVGAKYLGGMPGVNAKDGIDGVLGVAVDGIEFDDHRKKDDLGIPFASILSVELAVLQANIRQAFQEDVQATIARTTLTPVVVFHCLTDAGRSEVRFYVTDGAGSFARLSAAGLANQAQNAIAFRDAVLEHEFEFAEAEPAPARGSTIAQTLRELAELRDEGIVTLDEFNEKKRQLLDRL